MEIDKHLVEIPERENLAVEVFLAHGIMHGFIETIGIESQAWWVIRNFRKARIAEGGGDIDLIIGTCVPDGKFWKPSDDFLVAVEAKCFYRTFDEAENQVGTNFKSVKNGPGKFRAIKGQLEWLTDAGFDRVIFLEMIANPPTDSFVGAANMAFNSFGNSLLDVVRDFRDLSHVYHFRMSVGAVNGGNEQSRGATGSPICLQSGMPNMKQNFDFRKKIWSCLNQVIPRPDQEKDIFSVVFPRVYSDSNESILSDETYRRFGLPIRWYQYLKEIRDQSS